MHTAQGFTACKASFAIASTLLATSALPQSVSNNSTMNDEELGRLQNQLRVFARSVHIPELSDNKPDELRIWMKDYMFGTVSGYRVANGVVTKCSIPVHGPADASATQPGLCVPHKIKQNARYVAPLSQLRSFDRYSVDCGVSDGSGVDVEGVVNNHWFAYHADNPDSCKDAASVLVSKVLRDLS
jgi:hypothetical protein